LYAEEGQAELFVERKPEDVATAVASDGKRYGDLDHAFRFREAYIPACHAQLKDGAAALAIRYLDAVSSLSTSTSKVTARLSVYPLPKLRPASAGEDPETIANRVGDLELGAVRTIAATDNTVRYVGEAYYAELYDLDGLPPATPEYRPPLGFDLLGAVTNTEVSGLSPSTSAPAAY
jgi:hypothetical protein